MYFGLILSLLSSSPSVFAKRLSESSSHEFCQFSILGSNSLLPICVGDRPGSRHQHLDLDNYFDEALVHRASDKPAQVILSAAKVGRQSQWATAPKCVQLQNTTEKYCVYTNLQFADNRGISIFTTPENAEQVRKLPAFTNKHIHEAFNNEPNPPYFAKQLPGRGIGLIANRTLFRSDRIFSNTPTVLIEEEIFDEFVPDDRVPLQNLAVNQLPPKSKKLTLDLCGHFGGDHVEDLINTNSFAVELLIEGEETVFNAVLPEISRMNHDCRPNAHYYFDPKTLTQHVHALRTILPGEEITISYIDPAQKRKARLHALKESWGFPCGCSSCSATSTVHSASDDRISQIEDIREELEDYASDSEANTAMAELLISLYEQERMWGPIAEAYALAALEYNGIGQAWTAQKYARLAVEVGLIYGGPHDEDVQQMELLLKDPWTHWSWMLRARKRSEGRSNS